MFLRITHAVSRRQEFVADELAARAVGSRPLIGGLRTIHGVAPAFNAFWRQECAPVLNAGYRPPLAEGFQSFLQAGPVAAAIHRNLDEELKTGKVDPYDTHPPLKERIAAVEHLPAGDSGADDPPATTLLADLVGVENVLVATLVKPEFADKLKPIHWDDVCSNVYLPRWTSLAQANTATLSGVTPESLPQLVADLKSFGLRLRTSGGEKPDEENAEGFAIAVLGSVLTVLLVSRGGKIHSLPGEAVRVTVGSTTIEPFGIPKSFADSKLTAEEWQLQCRELEIAGMDFGRVMAATETRR